MKIVLGAKELPTLRLLLGLEDKDIFQGGDTGHRRHWSHAQLASVITVDHECVVRNMELVEICVITSLTFTL